MKVHGDNYKQGGGCQTQNQEGLLFPADVCETSGYNRAASKDRDKGTGIEATSQCHMPINKLFMWDRVWDSLSITAQTHTHILAHFSAYNGKKDLHLFSHNTDTFSHTQRVTSGTDTCCSAEQRRTPPLTSLLHTISEHNSSTITK